MKLQIISDLHLEFGICKDTYDSIMSASADILVIAGDLCSSRKINKTLNTIQKDSGKVVLFVPGNHDYYGSSKAIIDAILGEVDNPNIHVLNEDKILLEGQKFIGTTGWWDKDPGVNVKGALNDFTLIKDIHEATNWGIKGREFIENNIDSNAVVITHHFPSRKSIHPRYKGSNINKGFCSYWEHLADIPKLWVHGHTHDSMDYINGNTRSICNPHGYLSRYKVGDTIIEQGDNFYFNPQLVVEV